MRVHRGPRIRHPWSDADRNTAASMLLTGSDYRSIAAVLGRKPDAVKAWVHHHIKAKREAPLEIEYPRVAVPHSDVVDWYLAGWRFDRFSGGMCVFEWRESGAPRYPKPKQTISAELEAA